MRAVTTGTAAFALGIHKKDLDNILSRYPVRGFERRTQGLARRLSLASIEQVAIAIDLTRDFSIPIPTALLLAEEALGSREGYCLAARPFGHSRRPPQDPARTSGTTLRRDRTRDPPASRTPGSKGLTIKCLTTSTKEGPWLPRGPLADERLSEA